MRIISLILVVFFNAFWSIPAYTAETFVCNNVLSDDIFIHRSKTAPEFATTSAVLNLEKDKITKVTYVVKAFVIGKIKETWKYSLNCNVPDVENDKLECLQDNIAKRLEGTEIDTSQISDYSYLKISKYPRGCI